MLVAISGAMASQEFLDASLVITLFIAASMFFCFYFFSPQQCSVAYFFLCIRFGGGYGYA